MNETDYGAFAGLVATVSSLVAAAAAITLAFMKRARWQPPVESVSKATSRVSGLVTAVIIAILYVFSRQLGLVVLALITVVLLVMAVWALIVSIQTNSEHSYFRDESKTEAARILGGDELTEEAQHIRTNVKKGRSPQELLWDAHGQLDLVWTRPSIARILVRSTLGFIVLISAGSGALAAAGLLVATSPLAAQPTAASDLSAPGKTTPK